MRNPTPISSGPVRVTVKVAVSPSATVDGPVRVKVWVCACAGAAMRKSAVRKIPLSA
ncbi:MAG: hypothetical protein OXU31_03985 [Gammaproteobacteria bacterium]|nr:hypothetical protein [Gammaproteobacteria bacterium]